MMHIEILNFSTLSPILAMTIAQIGRAIEGRENCWTFGEIIFFPFACVGVIAISNEIFEKREKRKIKLKK